MSVQETYSVTEIKRMCEKSTLLDGSGISEGDKGVSFDGNIMYYKDGTPKKSGNEFIIPVQVKGKIFLQMPASKNLSYPIDVLDLNSVC